MRTRLTLFLFFFAGCIGLRAQTQHAQPKEARYEQLQILSATNLSISSYNYTDSLLRLSQQMETAAQASGDSKMEFKTGQILVNIHGLQGNIAPAVSKAQKLLDKASHLHNPLAEGLAIQAIGDTYMHTGRYAQADSLFTEASPYLSQSGDPFLLIELHFQHLHTHVRLQDMPAAEKDIAQIQQLLDTSTKDLPAHKTYEFLLTSYRLFVATQQHDIARAKVYFETFSHLRSPQPQTFNIWIHHLKSQYAILNNDIDTALAHSDSTLKAATQGGNGNITRYVMMYKADLLEKIGREDEACEVYQQISLRTDSLNQQQYIAQIDSMHVTYWVDQLQLSNIERRNKMYANLLCGLLVVVAITAVVTLLIRRKNRQIDASRRELQRIREESEDALHTKSLFLSNMSHELRTPLNAIAGFSSILTDTPDLDDETRHECNNYICQNADLLLKLISDVVDVAELKDNNIRFTYGSCEVVSLCRNVLKTVDNVKRTQAQMHFVTDLDSLLLETDKNRLQQVLINLLINATKFTTKGDITLTLHYDSTREEALFAIEDTGCGIPLEKQGNIFERFEKLHEGIQGAGLGLSICKLIVEHSGGKIWIDSTYTQGARFVFTHPLKPKKHEA